MMCFLYCVLLVTFYLALVLAYKQKLLDSIDAEIFKKEEDKRQLNVKVVDNIKMEVDNEKNVGFENDQQDLSRINSTEDSLNCDFFQSSNGNKSNEVEERFIKQKQRDDLLVENSQQVSTRKTSFEHGRKRRLNERVSNKCNVHLTQNFNIKYIFMLQISIFEI